MRSCTYTFDGHACRVSIGVDILAAVGELISRCGRGPKVLVVSDSNVAPLYADAVLASMRGVGLECRLAVVPPGERSKSSEQLAALYDKLASMRLGRDGLVVSVGGGVVNDLAGYAAATWLRGVDFVTCPTSLLAAVDASVGGKTGVNHHAGKNLIGAFHQPVEVVVDAACLRTLDRRDLVAGLAESLKHGLIEDRAFVLWHETHRKAIMAWRTETLAELAARNIAIKARIVEQDPREQSGVRARLNFGHTIGHAIERSCGYELRHGECVALGMVAAARMSRALGLLGADDCVRVEALVQSFGLPVRYEELASFETLAPFIAGDKKVAAACVRWVLLTDLGAPVVRDDVPEDAVRQAVESLR